MATTILFSIGEPKEIILDDAISNDPRLLSDKGLPAGVHDKYNEYEKRHETTIYLLGVLSSTVVLCDETKSGEEIGLLNVASITHAIPRLEMDAGRLA
ncbi:MAG: hypothetical protein AAB800_04090 [Patescibacteria group bacterium]